jgi:hypothetical protein
MKQVYDEIHEIDQDPPPCRDALDVMGMHTVAGQRLQDGIRQPPDVRV